MMKRAFFFALSALIGLSAASGDKKADAANRSCAPVTAQSTVESTPLTLVELTDSAEEIFVGRVEAIRDDCVTPKGSNQGFSVDALEIDLRIDRVLKGELRRGDVRTITRLGSAMNFFVAGEEVLLFLSEEGVGGFVEPVGVHSGHFKVRREGIAQAMNLWGNAGLWEDEESHALWEKACRRQAGSAAEGMEAHEPIVREPVPLETVLFAAEERISQRRNQAASLIRHYQ